MVGETQVWVNRIVGSGREPAAQLLANEKNWRIHPKQQQDALAGIMGQLGWIQQVIVNKRTSERWGANRGVETLVDGHLRVAMAISQGEETEVPVLYVDLEPEEEALALASIDPIAALATADKEQLDGLLREVSTGDAAVQAMLAKLAADEGIVPPDVTFKEYDESVADEVEYLTCPECGHKWPK